MVLSPDAQRTNSPPSIPGTLAGSEDVVMDGAIGEAEGREQEAGTRTKAEPITDRMGDLKMQSPDQATREPPGPSSSRGSGDNFEESSGSREDGTPGRRMPDRKNSSSTDSDMSYHPYIPSQSGSIYNADGFPKSFMYYGPSNSAIRTDSPEASMLPAAHAAVSAADEAIKQLNGTAATVYGGTTYSGFPPPPDNPYQLPRGFAGFVRPQQGYRGMEPGVTRQSSMSSSTTEASTSSEEEDLTLPSVMWLPSNKDKEREEGQNAAAASWLYGGKAAKQTGRSVGRGDSPYGGRTSPQKMPPPPLHRVSSPHIRPGSAGPSGTRAGGGVYGHPPTFSAYHPGSASGAASGSGSALPDGMSPGAPAEVDDDGTTVGAPEQVSSASSISASSGLDLLWRAVTHDHTESPGDDHSAGIRSPRGEVEDTKGKRKAGAEAVAQWRQSGIPLGVGAGAGQDAERRRRESTNSTDANDEAGGEVVMSPPPHKKRRKSSAQTDLDRVKKDGRATSFSSQGRPLHVAPPSAHSGGGGRGRSPSTDADANGDAEWESQSDDDEGESEADSDYAGSSNRRPSAAATSASASGRIRKPSAKMKLATAHAAAGPSGSRKSGTSGSKGVKGSSGAKGGARKGSTTSGLGAGGGGGKKAAGSSAGGARGSESPAPPGKGAKANIPAGGVQCEYVNPLPVSFRSSTCIFTSCGRPATDSQRYI